MESTSKKRVKLHIFGIVQGVGFRPFVYQLAIKYSLKGFVFNDGRGVVIEVEGKNAKLSQFINDLKLNSPSLARIDYIEQQDIDLVNDEMFSIIHSETTTLQTMVSPDISLCDECRAEMNDVHNRRYKYPFINCTNCGPRYTIIDNLPYDRHNTSMEHFNMCEACTEEYNDPTNRRYHAQPIGCFDCGPNLKIINLMEDDFENDQGLVKIAVQYINDGKTIAVKGMGGFHLICDATNDAAVLALRLHKHRQKKPLAVMFPSISCIKKVTKLSKTEEKLIVAKERPIVVVQKNKSRYLSKFIAPEIDRIGVFLPYTPLHELLLQEVKKPLVATSANLSDEPIIRDDKELFKKLHLVAQTSLTHNREIINACDDSVVMDVYGEPIFLRLSRGYTPKSFYLQNKSKKKVLALGANQKNTITLAFDNNIIVSPHIGDLNSLEAFDYFLRTVETFKRFYDFEPDILVCDKHPKYETTKWAKEYIQKYTHIELIQVQHHYAHALSVMAEYNLNERVLAFCFDGTGYGDDGTLWGGEVLLATPTEYERIVHLKEFTLLGGEKAIKEPRRIALSLLFEYFSITEILQMDHSLVKSFTKNEIETFYLMRERAINSPKSTSIGRLFDAVYALCDNLQGVFYEGQSGLVLESYAEKIMTHDSYHYTMNEGIIDCKIMLEEIMSENDVQKIAAKFINAVAKIVIDICLEYRELPVVLSGGVFQNKLLLQKCIEQLKKNSMRYYIQHQTPINDGGISLGQAYYALHI
ncbi:carbamoyltransferase HypF [Sulfurimonas paralvinellae]|uniref:carbamoyltransferase HypF n=1 Tax=Sulfurimonas paralvinellae TaxID=317658 RepID=UPI001D058B4D|nr:carbamoyltransferase HypF [Sulfurimonas paralvinellae]